MFVFSVFVAIFLQAPHHGYWSRRNRCRQAAHALISVPHLVPALPPPPPCRSKGRNTIHNLSFVEHRGKSWTVKCTSELVKVEMAQYWNQKHPGFPLLRWYGPSSPHLGTWASRVLGMLGFIGMEASYVDPSEDVDPTSGIWAMLM